MSVNLPFLAAALVAVIGLVVTLTRRNLIMVIMGLGLFESAVNLFLVSLGYRQDGIAPIFTNAPAGAVMVTPTVQALTLTSIVIGLATTALLLSFAVLLKRYYGTLDLEAIRKLKG
jgi:multicomponent Na+:H+ antiporter subunit C